MVELFQLAFLLVIAVTTSFWLDQGRPPEPVARRNRTKSRIAMFVIAFGTFLGCLTTASFLHEPTPRGHDEFSYLLMADTLAHGRVVNSPPGLSEFFDTFHVIIHPVYASKYFPAQGVFLAIGEKLTGHPAVGVWLSSALACTAAYWMLLAWIGPNWAMLGGFLMMIQYGIFSYWSQSYWGGMVAALGGALAFGAARRLWDEFSWKRSLWLAIGIVVLVNSRPLEGTLALLPIGVVFLIRLWREQGWKRAAFGSKFVLPVGMVLILGASLTCAYNRAITGSLWKPPHVLHEAQYQETPEFAFLPMHPKITYSSLWLQYLYGVREVRTYQATRDAKTLPNVIARKLATWWSFYCGILLTPALVVPGLLRKGRVRLVQAVLLILLPLLWMLSGPESSFLRSIFDLLALSQIILFWFVFKDFWPRLAIATLGLLILECFATKWFFPHYSAPVACLVLYLQMEGLRYIWNWKKHSDTIRAGMSRKERRRLIRGDLQQEHVPQLRGFVYLLPIACVLSLAVRVEARKAGWSEDPHGPDRYALLMNDWSLRRAELQRWLAKQPGPQLVFVTYSAYHNVNYEWVYNDADLQHSRVVWARDLGPEHNRLLLQQMPDRTVWWLEADSANRQLVPYTEHNAPPLPYRLDNNRDSEADSPGGS